MGYKFRRQHVIRKYILDFFCPAAKLGIELDGKVHLVQEEHDEFRSSGLLQKGIRILRFKNETVLDNSEAVVDAISATLQKISIITPPPQAGKVGRGT